MRFDIAIVIEPREERVLRKLHKESQRARRMRHRSVSCARDSVRAQCSTV